MKFTNILKLFREVQGLKRPKLVVCGFKITRTSPKHPAELHVARDGGRFIGSIYSDGRFLRHGKQVAVPRLLESLEANPHTLMIAEGLRTGWCCYCGRKLTDFRSTSKGYGPVCARRWSLPWGDDRSQRRRHRRQQRRHNPTYNQVVRTGRLQENSDDRVAKQAAINASKRRGPAKSLDELFDRYADAPSEGTRSRYTNDPRDDKFGKLLDEAVKRVNIRLK